MDAWAPVFRIQTKSASIAPTGQVDVVNPSKMSSSERKASTPGSVIVSDSRVPLESFFADSDTENSPLAGTRAGVICLPALTSTLNPVTVSSASALRVTESRSVTNTVPAAILEISPPPTSSAAVVRSVARCSTVKHKLPAAPFAVIVSPVVLVYVARRPPMLLRSVTLAGSAAIASGVPATQFHSPTEAS